MKTSEKGFIGIILIIFIALAVGTGTTYYVTKEKREVKVVEESAVMSDTDTNVKVNNQKQNTDVSANAQTDVQVQENIVPPQLTIPKGAYQFVELSGSGSSAQTWVYELGVPNGGAGNLTLTVDGFQVKTRINAIGRINQGSLDVIFDSYGPDNMFTSYSKGDVLFTVKPTNSGLAFEWKKMKPYLPLNAAGGYFGLKNNYFDN